MSSQSTGRGEGEDSDSATMQIKCVYHSLESVFSVLRREEYKALPEVQELLEVFNLNYTKTRSDAATNKKKPFIVLEGLDASGKTTVGCKLAMVLKGIKKTTPPDCLLPLREKFDVHPVALRRAYYGLGNYIAGREVEVLCRDQPVVMDRFWHSTTAYAIAHEIGSNRGVIGLPPLNDPVYIWPQDLTKPDVVIFLNLEEKVRNQRHAHRNTVTPEEEVLKENEVFRSIVLEAYKRMDKPSITEVDSNQSIEDVVEDILRCIDDVV